MTTTVTAAAVLCCWNQCGRAVAVAVVNDVDVDDDITRVAKQQQLVLRSRLFTTTATTITVGRTAIVKLS